MNITIKVDEEMIAQAMQNFVDLNSHVSSGLRADGYDSTTRCLVAVALRKAGVEFSQVFMNTIDINGNLYRIPEPIPEIIKEWCTGIEPERPFQFQFDGHKFHSYEVLET